MEEIICGVDNSKCNEEMCKHCKKYSKEVIENALNEKREEYLKKKKEYENFYNNVRRKYIPSCKYGYTNCIYDKEYIKAYYPEWYKELEAENGALSCDNCEDGSEYDDEDK